MSIVGNGGNKDIQGKYNAITAIAEHTRAIHDGLAFSIDADGSVLKGSSIYFLGRTGSKQVHFDQFTAKFSQGLVRIYLYEAPTITTPGTPSSGVNLNFAASTIATMITYLGPTPSDNGILKSSKYLPISGGGANTSPSEGGIAGGRVLKANTDYLFRIQNLDTNNDITFGATFEWHESDIVLP